VYASQDSLLSL